MRESTNAYKEFELQMRALARKNSTPLFGGFELTPRCNFNCKMCYVHLEESLDVKSKELTTDQLLSVFESACSAGMLYATFTGGECLLRNDFEELYSFLAKKGVQLTIKTNGFLLHKYLDLFNRYPPHKLSVTMYGSNEDVYETVTGVRGFNIVLNALKSAKRLNTELVVSLTPSRLSFEDTPKLVSFLINNNYKYAITPFLIPRRDGSSSEDYSLSFDEQIELAAHIHLASGKQLVNIDDSQLPPTGGELNIINHGIECSAGSYRFNLTWDGFVVPCLCLDSPRINILDVGFEKAWEILQENDEQVIQPIECNGCAYRSVCVSCPFLRYETLFSGQCNKELCKFTREKVKRGILKL